MDIKLIFKKTKGFSLVELILVIIIISILAYLGTSFLTLPVKGFTNVLNRSEVANSADLVFTRFTRDLRRALPNSVRVKPGNPKALEFVNVVEGFRYRALNKPGEDIDDNKLIIKDGEDSAFNVMAEFPASMLGNNGYRVVVFNPGEEGVNSDDPIAGNNVYNPNPASGSEPPPPVPGGHVITPSSTTVTLSNISGEGRVTLSSPMQFAFEHPIQRVYFIDSPISYIFDDTTGTITRYSGYNMSSIQPTNPNVAPLAGATSVATIARGVANCTFEYDRNLSLGYGIVIMTIEFVEDAEKIILLDQVYVSNVP